MTHYIEEQANVKSSSDLKSRVSRRKWWLFGLTFLVIGGVGGAVWWGIRPMTMARPASPGSQREIRETAAHGEPIRVEVVRPLPGGITYKSQQPGSVQAFEFADLYAKVSGYLKDQVVDFGSRVQRGQVLAEIDVPELVKDADRAAAAVAQAQAQV